MAAEAKTGPGFRAMRSSLRRLAAAVVCAGVVGALGPCAFASGASATTGSKAATGKVATGGNDWQSCSVAANHSTYHVKWIQAPEWFWQEYHDTVTVSFSGLTPGVPYRVEAEDVGKWPFIGSCVPPVTGHFSAAPDSCPANQTTCSVPGVTFVPKVSSFSVTAGFDVWGLYRAVDITTLSTGVFATIGCFATVVAGCAPGAVAFGLAGLALGLDVSFMVSHLFPDAAVVTPYAIKAVPVSNAGGAGGPGGTGSVTRSSGGGSVSAAMSETSQQLTPSTTPSTSTGVGHPAALWHPSTTRRFTSSTLAPARLAPARLAPARPAPSRSFILGHRLS